MIRRWARALLLLFALSLLLVPVVRTLRGPFPGGGLEPGDRLLSLEGDARFLSIENDSGRVGVERREGWWWVEEPVAERANPSAVSAVLSLLREAPLLRIVEARPESAGPFGLDPPAAEVAVDGETLSIGDLNPTRDGVYVRKGRDGAVLLSDRSLLALQRVGLGRIRDRWALPFKPGEVAWFVVVGGEESMTVERRPGRGWLAREVALRADSRSVGALLRNLSTASIHSFPPDSGRGFGGDGVEEEILRYTVSGEGGEKELAIGARLPGTSLRRCRSSERESAFHLAEWVVDSLLVHTHSLIDRKIVHEGLHRRDHFFYQAPPDTFSLSRRADGAWQVKEIDEGPGSGPLVRAFLLNWERLEGDPLPLVEGGWKVGPDPWRLGAPPETVSVWERKEDGRLLAQRAGEEGALLLGEGARPFLDMWGEDLLEAPPLPNDLDQATSVRVEYPGFQVDAEKDGGQWRITGPFPARAKQDLFVDLLKGLSAVRHQRWSRSEDLPAPVVTVRVKVGRRLTVVRMSPFAAPMRLSLPNWEGVFELSPESGPAIPRGLSGWMDP